MAYDLICVKQGVYDIHRSQQDAVRLIVLSQIPVAEHNVIWNLFSGKTETIQSALAYATNDWDPLRASVVLEILSYFNEEVDMNAKHYAKALALNITRSHLSELPASERLQGLSLDEIAALLSEEDLAKLQEMQKHKKLS